MGCAQPLVRVSALLVAAILPCISADSAGAAALRGAAKNASAVSALPSQSPNISAAVEMEGSEVSATRWGGWHHGIPGETCCMCQANMGFTTLLYSAEDYHHMYGTHNAWWQCQHECPRKCQSDWHHGRFFGCYDERHLMRMDRDFGRRRGYSIYYGHFGGLCFPGDELAVQAVELQKRIPLNGDAGCT